MASPDTRQPQTRAQPAPPAEPRASMAFLLACATVVVLPSQAFVLRAPTDAITAADPCRNVLSPGRFDSGPFAGTSQPLAPTAVWRTPGEIFAWTQEVSYLSGKRRGSSISPTMAASRHDDHHHETGLGGRVGRPIINATGKAAPPPHMAVGGPTNQSSRKRRRRPMIGPAVWAAFKEEQKGVTRTLLGLPDEDEDECKDSSKDSQNNNNIDKEKDSASDASGQVEREPDQNEQLQEQQQQHQAGSQDQQSTAPRTTLGAFMTETRSRSPEMEAMVPIMKAVGKTCTAVSRLVRHAQLEGMAGLYQGASGNSDEGNEATVGTASNSVNIQGEVQKELDVLSNSIFLTGFCQPHGMSCVASEEEEVPRMCAAVVGDEMHGGEYAAVFDPLDGSANIEAGLPCGTIFGILRTSGSAREGHTAGPSTIVLPGRRLVAAGYCLYGPSTKLVFTLGEGVFEFTLEGEGDDGTGTAAVAASDKGMGEGAGLGGGGLNFVLSRSNVMIPRKGRVYSVNEANSVSWSEAIQDYFEDLKTKMLSRKDDVDGGNTDSEVVSPRRKTPSDTVENQYAGALVADIHNILFHGGVFAYPADVRNPNGKLRLLYEGNPMAMIVEQAGGVATTGFEPIRDVRPQSVHHRIPAFFGSPDDLLPLLNPRFLHSKR